MTIPIDHDVPIPAITRMSKYPFDDMEVGDSFTILPEASKNISSAIGAYCRKRSDGRKFITRSIEGGVRIWRVR